MRLLASISLLILVSGTQAQDYTLSQYFNMPLNLNPALTGNMEEDLRASMTHKNQWASISNAFVTTTASYDMPLLQKRTSPNYLGVGGFVLKDKAGKSQMGLLQAYGSAAYAVGFNDYNLFMSGISIGYSQRSITIEGLAWDSQFNGVGYDPALDHGESISDQKRSYVDVAGGFVWQHKKRLNYSIGYSFWHYGQKQGFLDNNEDKLFGKHVLHADWKREWRQVDLLIHSRAIMQSGAIEINAGISGKYRIGLDSRYTNHNTSSAVMAGCFYRIGDAIIPMVGYEFQRMVTAWFSYDINLSALNIASNYSGGWEVHLMYSGWLTQQRRRLR